MKTILIRDLPEDMHETFKIMCIKSKTSMQAYLFNVVAEAVESARFLEKQKGGAKRKRKR